jgi:hypothetical protein
MSSSSQSAANQGRNDASQGKGPQNTSTMNANARQAYDAAYARETQNQKK